MQPKMCTKCKKNIAVVFITKMENGVTMNEGYCLKCARSLGIPQIDQAVKQMGISEEDLDLLSDEMSSITEALNNNTLALQKLTDRLDMGVLKVEG